MRVLFWSDLFWPYVGGPEILARKLLPRLTGRGHDFLVVTSQYYLELPDQEDYCGIRILRFPFRAALSRGAMHEIAQMRREIAWLKERWAPPQCSRTEHSLQRCEREGARCAPRGHLAHGTRQAPTRRHRRSGNVI
jgi:hypothetical protein